MRLIVFLVNVLVMCLFSSTGNAQAVNPKYLQFGNQTLTGIYQEIESQKANYKELENFSRQNLLVDDKGFYVLKYEYFGLADSPSKKTYSFMIRLTPLNIGKATSGEQIFLYNYPLLGISLIGEQFLMLKTKQLDIRSVVESQQELLAEEQQKLLPFKLSIKPAKDSFKENEGIEFVVTLQNISGHNLKVKNLSSKSLQFTINDKVWETEESQVANKQQGEYTVLKNGEVMSKTFTGQGLGRMKEFRILCRYNMSHQGVKPEAVLKVKIQKSFPQMTL